MIVVATDDQKLAAEVREALAANQGYCPSKKEHIPENICMCSKFISSPAGCVCDCGLYKKVEE